MSIPLPRPVKDVLFRSYHKVRNSWPIWYYLLNREPRSVLAAQNPDMSDMVVASIIKDLRRDGIAVTSLKELFPSISLDELKRFLDVSLAHPRIREEITKHQQMIDERVDGGDERKGGGKYLKDFIVEPWGSTGNNTLTSTAGNDLFVGHGGQDTFVFAPNFGNDVVTDFRAGGRSHDVIQFSKSVFDSFASVLAHASQIGQDVVISADASDSVTLALSPNCSTSCAACDRV